MRIAVSRDCKTLFGEPRIVNTPKGFDEGMAVFSELAKELCGGEKIKMAGGGIAGPLDKDRTKLLNSPHIPGWIGKPLKKKLSNILGAPVYIANDTAMVGLGETHFGAGKGYNIVVYITVSTGVGGVRIVDGLIDKRAFGFEPGHQVIDIDNTVCPKCLSGQLEDLISGTAVERRYHKKPYEVQDETLWNEELPKWLAYGLANTIMHWSPEVVVLGGSMVVGDPAISVSQTKKYLQDILKIFTKSPDIKKAECGDSGGLYGALVFMDQHNV